MNTGRSNKTIAGIVSEIFNWNSLQPEHAECARWNLVSKASSAFFVAFYWDPVSHWQWPCARAILGKFLLNPHFYPISKPQRQSQREWLLFNSWIWHCHLFVNSVSPQTEPDTSFVKPGTKRKILNYQELQDSKNRILPTHRIVSKGFLVPWTLSLLTHMLLRFPINQCHMSFIGYNIFDMIPWSLLSCRQCTYMNVCKQVCVSRILGNGYTFFHCIFIFFN